MTRQWFLSILNNNWHLENPYQISWFGLLFILVQLNSVQVMFKEQLDVFQYAGVCHKAIEANQRE